MGAEPRAPMKSWPWPASPIASATATNIPPPRLTIVGCRRTIERTAATLARIKGAVSLTNQPSPPSRSVHWVSAESRLRGPQHLDLFALRRDGLLLARSRRYRPARYLDRGGWRALLPELSPRHGRRGRPRGRRRGPAQPEAPPNPLPPPDRVRDQARSDSRGQPDRQGMRHLHLRCPQGAGSAGGERRRPGL